MGFFKNATRRKNINEFTGLLLPHNLRKVAYYTIVFISNKTNDETPIAEKEKIVLTFKMYSQQVLKVTTTSETLCLH